jgi:hypothetical protein
LPGNLQLVTGNPESTLPRTDIDSLSDASRIWLFGISPALDESKRTGMMEQVDLFLRDWAAHNEPVTSAREILHDSFLLIAVDQRSETSGCSIDRMFGLLRQLERDLGVSILDPNRLFVRHGDGHVSAMSRTEFRTAAAAAPLTRSRRVMEGDMSSFQYFEDSPRGKGDANRTADALSTSALGRKERRWSVAGAPQGVAPGATRAP